MVRVTFRVTGSLNKIAKSDALADQLEALGAQVLAAAANDPNPDYVASLRMGRFVTDRVSIQVGAHPVIGSRVEAKRGTLSRALGQAGLK